MISWELNPTKAIGLVCYGAASLACWAVRGATPRRRPWTAAGVVFGLLWLDVLTDARLRLHDVLLERAKAAGEYNLRGPLQVWADVAIACGVLVGIWLAFRRVKGGPVRLAGGAAAVGCLMALTELISWHVTDAILYRHLFGTCVVGVIWAGLGAFGVTGAIWQGRRDNRLPPSGT